MHFKGCPGGSELDPHLVCTLCGIGTFREDASKIDRCKPCGDNMTTFDIGSRSQEQCVRKDCEMKPSVFSPI